MKNSILKTLLATFVTLFSTLSFSAEWFYQTLDLVSEDGSETITVSLDYQLSSTGSARYQRSTVFAETLFVNIWANGSKAEGRAYISELSYNEYVGLGFGYYLTPQGRNQLNGIDSQIVNLSADGNYLTGRANKSVFMFMAVVMERRTPTGIQEIAVVIDGVWYKGFDGQNALFSLYRNSVN